MTWPECRGCPGAVPARAARIDAMHSSVVIDYLPVGGLAGAPYSSCTPPNPQEERAARDYFAPVVRTRRSDDEDTLDYPRF